MIKNTDNQCFKWCVTRALNPVNKNGERVTKLLETQAQQLHWDGIEFPVTLHDITKFEKLNKNTCGAKGGIAINVFYIDGKCIASLRISKLVTPDKLVNPAPVRINLLLYNDHYCLINNLSRLLTAQMTNHNGARLFCHRCLCSFTTQAKLDEHDYYCRHHTPRRVTIPGDVVKFKNYNHSMKVPFAIYMQISNLTLSL